MSGESQQARGQSDDVELWYLDNTAQDLFTIAWTNKETGFVHDVVHFQPTNRMKVNVTIVFGM